MEEERDGEGRGRQGEERGGKGRKREGRGRKEGEERGGEGSHNLSARLLASPPSSPFPPPLLTFITVAEERRAQRRHPRLIKGFLSGGNWAARMQGLLPPWPMFGIKSSD